MTVTNSLPATAILYVTQDVTVSLSASAANVRVSSDVVFGLLYMSVVDRRDEWIYFV